MTRSNQLISQCCRILPRTRDLITFAQPLRLEMVLSTYEHKVCYLKLSIKCLSKVYCRCLKRIKSGSKAL